MLAYTAVCCSHQSNHRIRVYISFQSDCRIGVCISHHSYHSIWYLATIIAFGYYFLLNDVLDQEAVHKE